VALAEIEEKGWERGLDDGMGRMVVLAEADRAQDRLSATQIEAIVEGTDEVLEVIAQEVLEGDFPPPITADALAREAHAVFNCVGGRGEIDDAAASVMAFALRHAGLQAATRRRGDNPSGEVPAGSVAIHLICYASHPSESMRRYTRRKLTISGAAGPARHAIIDYDVAPAPAPSVAGIAGPRDTFVGDIATLCRLAGQHAVDIDSGILGSVALPPRFCTG
jgi:hypothetical protein